MDEYTSDLKELLAAAQGLADDADQAKRQYEIAIGNASRARMHFLEAKVARWGFMPNTLFYLTHWEWKMVGTEWKHINPHEVLCIFKRVGDCGGLESTCVTDPNALPSMIYSERLKSGRWSTREHYLWAQDASTLMKDIRFA